MRSTRNTVGGVFAAITAGISLVMAIWDVVSWIMTMSLGNIFAGRPFLSFFVALFQESIFDFGDTQMHLLFAGTMLFFMIGACVNFLAAIVLLKRGSNHKGASITLGIINEVGIIFWIIFSGRAGFYVGKYIIGNGCCTGVGTGNGIAACPVTKLSVAFLNKIVEISCKKAAAKKEHTKEIITTDSNIYHLKKIWLFPIIYFPT